MKCRGGSSGRGRGVVGQNNDVKNKFPVVENGFSNGENSGGSSHESLKTYKRRRYNNMNSSESKVLENGNVAVDKFSQLPEQPMYKETMDRDFRNFSDDGNSGTDTSHLDNSRVIILNQLYQSLPETEGGLLEHIKDKTPVLSCVDVEKCPSSPGYGPLALTCNGSSFKKNRANTDLCREVFFDIVKSKKFAQLCDVLSKSFDGAKFDSILDIRPINSRMKDGAYEKSPMLFQSDMQKLWEHLQKVGAEIDSLSKNLMDMSKASCSREFSEFDLHTKMEQTEAFGVPKICSCQQCGDKAEGKDCLVCDSCEEIYHVSCIKPPIKEIPQKSWYCINCVAIGIGSSHENCVVCEKLNTTLPPNNGVSYEEFPLEFEEIFQNGGNICNICKTEVLSSKNIKVCGHSFCLHRYYHINCLTNKQLRTYGPCWYCPSCLCRACLKDQDDNKIVMCDGCDSAYHIYCMQPPLDIIPEGNWFCIKCDAGIQKIAKAKRDYERIEKKRRGKNGKGIVDEDVVGKSGGVDMLLSAAITLKCEEKVNAAEMEN